MKPSDLMIRCVAMREHGQWVAVCLPFDLAAQGDSLRDVKHRLEAQISDYLRDALVGQDRKHAEYLLNRRAPLKYWLIYAASVAVSKLRTKSLRGYKTPMPMSPIAC